jgi:cytochrome c oxidase subunit 3
MLLLMSGVTITIAHNYIIRGRNSDAFSWYLFLTIFLGSIFLLCQAYEYKYGVKFS